MTSLTRGAAEGMSPSFSLQRAGLLHRYPIALTDFVSATFYVLRLYPYRKTGGCSNCPDYTSLPISKAFRYKCLDEADLGSRLPGSSRLLSLDRSQIQNSILPTTLALMVLTASRVRRLMQAESCLSTLPSGHVDCGSDSQDRKGTSAYTSIPWSLVVEHPA